MLNEKGFQNHRINLGDRAVEARRAAGITVVDDDPVVAAIRTVRERLAETGTGGQMSTEASMAFARTVLAELSLTEAERADALGAFQRDQFGYGPLDPYMKDPAVTEILVDGPHHVDIEKHGQLETVPVTWRSNAQLHEYLKALIQHTGRPLDLAHPIVNAEVMGHRINITSAPVTVVDTLNIRKSVAETRRYTPAEYVKTGAIDVPGMRLLLLLYRAGANLLICGPTGSGKTTVGRIITEYGARADVRFIALEDTRELELQVPRFIGMQTVERSERPISMDELFATVKRKRPDRILIGEVREGIQAVPYLMAIMAGHDGTLGTMHAGTPEDAFHNFVFFLSSAGINVNEQFLMQVLHHAVHVIVLVTKFARGQRRITRIVAVNANGTFEDLYRWEYRQQQWNWVHPLPLTLEERCFIAEVPVPAPEERLTEADLDPKRLDAWRIEETDPS